MIKVVLADDHAIVRGGLKQILEADASMRVVFEANNGIEAFEFVSENTVDVVVMDITMPGRNGLETLKDIKRLKPYLPVIILSMHPEDQYAIRVIKAGAAGYLSKESDPKELVDAIKKACAGRRYISTEVAELLAHHIERGPTDEPHKKLSDREFEIFLLIAQGKSLTEIAKDIDISIKTVSTYRTRLIDKTALSTNSAMTKYCVERGLI